MDIGIIVTVTGVVVAGFAAVLGIWMERDERKPPRYAYALSALILLATVVSVMQTYLDSKASEKLEGDMARMLLQLDKLAANSDDPELMAFLDQELNAQARANPDVVEKLAQRVSDEGGDPAAMLGKHIDAAELESISRKGLIKTKKKETKGGKKKDEKKKDKKALTKEEKAERKAERKAEAKEAKKEARQTAKNWENLTKEEKQALKGEMTKEEKQALRDAKRLLQKREAKKNWENLSKEEKQKWKQKFGKDAKGGKGDDAKTAADAKKGKKKGKDQKAGKKKGGKDKKAGAKKGKKKK